MNKNILNTGVQDFISKNLNTDIMSVLLKKSIFDNISSKELAEQIESKKKCKKKLPLWFKTPEIYFPKKLNIEQTSSETTARYKSQIVSGKSLLDLTGGFGIDSFYFSKKMKAISHCEIDSDLAEISQHNFDVLGAKNVESFNINGISFLSKCNDHFDWIYADPSRRNIKKGKVFFLEDYTPDITKHFELLFNKTNNVLLKTAPLLDISAGINVLKYVKEIHIVSVQNEVKELLWVLNKDFAKDPIIKTINFSTSKTETFNFTLSDESKSTSKFSEPEKYLYEPNASLLKSGSFKLIGKHFNLTKLHQHTHLYTSTELIDFPGRRFEIKEIHSYSKSILKKLALKKANITTRNFPDSVATIRKKYGIKDGGSAFLFFFRNNQEKLQFMLCNKI